MHVYVCRIYRAMPIDFRQQSNYTRAQAYVFHRLPSAIKLSSGLIGSAVYIS